MITKNKIIQIHKIWDNYINSDRVVLDTKGNILPEIDKLRIDGAKQLQHFVNEFISGSIPNDFIPPPLCEILPIIVQNNLCKF